MVGMTPGKSNDAANGPTGRPLPDPLVARCPSRQLIGALASKWVLLVLPLLREGPKRNGALLHAVEGISQRVLTRTLRNLERYRLVERRDYGEVPPRVEYVLTPLGHSLADALASLDAWVRENAYVVTETSSEIASPHDEEHDTASEVVNVAGSAAARMRRVSADRS